MNFISEDIENYVLDHTSPESPVLSSLNRHTHSSVMMPRMLSGHLQGRILSMISFMIQPNRVLEIGTYTGYSAICLAEGLNAGGMLHTIDNNDELEKLVREYISFSGYDDRIKLHIGDARSVIPTLKETWDLVFIDADKKNYALYYDLVFSAIRMGGFIIADNVLWSGKVLGKEPEMDGDTLSIHQFNKKIAGDDRIEKVMLPVRDGLMVCRKIKE